MRSSYLLTVALSAVAYAIPIATQQSSAGGSSGALQVKPREYLSSAGKVIEKREAETEVEAKMPGFVGAEVEVEVEIEEDEVEVELEAGKTEAEVEVENKGN